MPTVPTPSSREPAASPATGPLQDTLPLPSPEASRNYRPPQLLRDLRLLDALELTGTTARAGRWLAISQPTVSRRCRRLVEDFGPRLKPRLAKRSRLGATASLRQLRLSARWHRFEAGVMALATDPLHQPLLEELEGLLPMPHGFRSGHDWLDLVRRGVIDAALVSSLELEHSEVGEDPTLRVQAGSAGRWPPSREPERRHLGHWPLRLTAAQADSDADRRRLLVPPADLAPGLRALLAGQGLMVECGAAALRSLAGWRRQMEAGDLATALPATLLGAATGPLAGLVPLAGAPELREHLWLLLPPDWQGVPVLRHTVEALEQRAIAAGALP
jgi:hypothetical protein